MRQLNEKSAKVPAEKLESFLKSCLRSLAMMVMEEYFESDNLKATYFDAFGYKDLKESNDVEAFRVVADCDQRWGVFFGQVMEAREKGKKHLKALQDCILEVRAVDFEAVDNNADDNPI